MNSKNINRQSNIELCRLISMFLILLLHANLLTFGTPEFTSGEFPSFNTIGRVFSQSCCTIAVNVFVLISGYFGIRLKKKGIANIIFQSMFYSIIGLAVMFVFYPDKAKISSIVHQLSFGMQYWFVACYIGLMALSPFLNAIDKISWKHLAFLCVVFYFYGGGVLFDPIKLNSGYSLCWFILLYMTGRYIKQESKWLEKLTAAMCWGGYLAMSSLATILVIGGMMLNISFLSGMTILSYNMPNVYIASICFFLAFQKMRDMKSNVINTMAASSFAIYLLHNSVAMTQPYITLIRSSYDGLGLQGIIAAVGAVGCAAILIDQIRIRIWKIIVNTIAL